MKRNPIQINSEDYPACFLELLTGSPLYDSSSSPDAKVCYIDSQGGFFLKSAPKGALGREASMTAYFHSKGIGAEVCAYESLDRDWLLTRAIPGEDSIHPLYLSDPKRLCDSAASFLQMLHHLSPAGCPEKT